MLPRLKEMILVKSQFAKSHELLPCVATLHHRLLGHWPPGRRAPGRTRGGVGMCDVPVIHGPELSGGHANAA